MGNSIATEDYSVTFYNGGVYNIGTCSYTTQYKTGKNKLQNKKTLLKELKGQMSGCTYQFAVLVSGGSWTMPASAAKDKGEGEKYMCENDTCQCSGIMQFLWFYNGCACTLTLKPGQSKAKGA